MANNHDHDHSHEHAHHSGECGHGHGLHGHDHYDTSNLRLAFFINLIFTIIEVIGGFWTNSVAILSDALHDLGDTLSLAMAWRFQKVANRQGDERYSYGYQRFSVLGAIISAVVLLIGSGFILSQAITRLNHPQMPDAKGMIWVAILGVVFNGIAASRLHHGHSHNEKMASLHLVEDVLGWVVVLIGSILMYYYQWAWLDPVLSLLIAGFILYNVFKSLRRTIPIFLQALPEGWDHHKVDALLRDLPLVSDYHDLHVWSLDGQKHIFDCTPQL